VHITPSGSCFLRRLLCPRDKPAHACRLGKVEQTEAKLETMYGAADARRMRGIGLSVKLNDRNARLLLDAVASEIRHTVGTLQI
jgi:hypothetical protein